MLGEQSQLLVLFGSALAVEAAFLYTVFRTVPARRARRGGTAAIERRPSGDRTEEATVVCPSCGTENEAGYRFCRSCLRTAFLDELRTGAQEPDGTWR